MTDSFDGDRDIFAELVKAKPAPSAPSVRGDFPPSSPAGEDGQLTIDVFQDDEYLYVQSAVAGVSPDDLDINITKEVVTLRGKRERSHRVAEDDFFYQECFWGAFSRSVVLPEEVDPDKSAASFKNGVLTVKMPKLNRRKRSATSLKVKAE